MKKSQYVFILPIAVLLLALVSCKKTNKEEDSRQSAMNKDEISGLQGKEATGQFENYGKPAARQPAPEIKLPDPNGDTIPLSSLKGKVVLIDFWASWCGPCRVENPFVVNLYNKYKDKGFEIYGVSLDRSREAWLQAIRDDKLTWIHVSDLLYFNSVVVNLYHIEGIPFTVLLDREGNIIATNLRGQALADKLKEVLG